MTNEDELPLPFFVKLCSDKAAFEARPTQRLSLKIDEVKQTLEKSKEHKIVIYTPHIIVFRSGRAETTLSRDGRMLIKRVSSEAEATKVAHRIFQTIRKGSFKP